MENRTFGNETSSNTTTENGIRDPVLGGTLFTINLFIVFLNTLAVLVIMRFRTKNCIDILVLGLAMMDLTKGLIPVPMSVCTYLSAWYLKKGSVACEFFGWIAFTTNSASMLILTLMAIERFVAIAKPFAYRSLITKKRMEISVLIAVLFSAGVSALPVLGLGRMVPYNHGAYCHFDYGDDTTRSKIYSIFILFYGFSMVVVVLAAYSIVFYKIRDLIKRHTRFSISRQAGRNTGKKDKGEIDLKVEKMFSYLTLGLMLLFWFSWFPFLAVLLLNVVKLEFSSHDTVDLFAMRIAVVSAMLNPIACASFCKPYRRGFIYYYRKLLSYAGFATPNSDVFDPWRQKSQNTRDQTPGNSIVAPNDYKIFRSRPITEFSSHTDSGFVSDSQTRFGRIPSVLEPLQNTDHEQTEEEQALIKRLQPVEECSQASEVEEYPLVGEAETGTTERTTEKFEADFDQCDCRIVQWKQNKSLQHTNFNQYGLDKNRESEQRNNNHGEEEIIIHTIRQRSEKDGQKKSKLKRYSMPLPYDCINTNRITRPKSLEGLARKHGKYRPWSLALNEDFREWLQENAFESGVKLTKFKAKEDGKYIIDGQSENASYDTSLNDSEMKLGNDIKMQDLEMTKKRLLVKAETFSGGKKNEINNFQNMEKYKKDFGQDAKKKQRRFGKYRSKSSPTARTVRTEQVVKYSSLRDDLSKSLQQMDLLTKSLLKFSGSRVKDSADDTVMV